MSTDATARAIRPHAGVAAAIGAGVVAGIAYAASPVTLWFGVAVIALCWWAARALDPRERRYVYAMLAAAIVVRVLLVVGLFVGSDHTQNVSFFWDGDGVYVKRRALALSQMWGGVPVGPMEIWHALHRPYGWSSYIYVLAYVQYLLGAAPYGVHLVAVALFTAAVALLYRVVRPAYGSAAALLGLAITLFLPTLVSWSVSALKESLYIFLAAVAVSAAVATLQVRRPQWRVVAAAICIGAIAALGTVRVNADLLMAASVGASLVAAWLVRHRRMAWMVAAAVPVLILLVSYDASARSVALNAARRAAATHLDYVRSGGHSYHLLDERFYAEPLPPPMTGGEAWRFTGRALLSVAIVPLPWQAASRTELAFLPQQVIWYVLAGFAVVGVIVGLRRDPVVTCMFATVAAVNGATIAVTNGNIGTMVRLRDMIVPFTTWLSAVGAVSVLSWCLAVVTMRSPNDVRSGGVIDDRGRLFGRINLIDGAIGVVVVALIPLAYGAFLLFREPTPTIDSVAPATIAADRPATLALTGDHFRAYLEPKIGDVSRIAFHAQTATEADVQVPALPPGTYDLSLWERGVELVRKRGAITVAAPVVQTARVRARVLALPDLLSLLHAGDLDVERAADPETSRASLVEIGDDRQATRAVWSTELAMPVGASKSSSATDPVAQIEQDVVSFTATLRVPVVSTPAGLSYHDRLVKIGAPIRFETTRGILRGWILSVDEQSQ